MYTILQLHIAKKWSQQPIKFAMLGKKCMGLVIPKEREGEREQKLPKYLIVIRGCWLQNPSTPNITIDRSRPLVATYLPSASRKFVCQMIAFNDI